MDMNQNLFDALDPEITETLLSRRQVLRGAGMMGAGLVLASIPATFALLSTSAYGKENTPQDVNTVLNFALKLEYLDRTRAFYARHGGRTIILARFVPIVRTFAPFVAGVGKMDYPRFLAYNVVGGVVWVLLLVGAGYFFGNIEVVRKNFELVVLGIIGISVLPVVFETIRGSRRGREKA